MKLGGARLLGWVMACAAPNTPSSPNRMMKAPATAPPRMNAHSIVFGSARNARSVSTLPGARMPAAVSHQKKRGFCSGLYTRTA